MFIKCSDILQDKRLSNMLPKQLWICSYVDLKFTNYDIPGIWLLNAQEIGKTWNNI